MASWNLRKAEPDDAPALADCIEAAYSIYAARIQDLPAVSEGIAEDIAHNLVWVAVLKEEIVGGLVLVPMQNHLKLANVAVEPSATGMGLGRALLELAENECRRLDFGEIRLSTHVEIPENIRLYEHFGWKKSGHSGNKVHMVKTIPD